MSTPYSLNWDVRWNYTMINEGTQYRAENTSNVLTSSITNSFEKLRDDLQRMRPGFRTETVCNASLKAAEAYGTSNAECTMSNCGCWYLYKSRKRIVNYKLSSVWYYGYNHNAIEHLQSWSPVPAGPLRTVRCHQNPESDRLVGSTPY